MRIITALASVALAGCISSAPTDNAPFASGSTLQRLDGSYRNLGSGGKETPARYLTQIIWPDRTLQHQQVERVDVKALDSTSVRVRARDEHGSVVKEGTFVEGKDFTFASGRLLIKRDLEFMGFRGGDVIVGPGYGTVELGVDESGEGKYEQDVAVAGLLFALFPFAMGSREEVRFARIKE